MNFEANLRSVAGPRAYAKPGKASNGFSFKHLLLLAAIDQYFFLGEPSPRAGVYLEGGHWNIHPPAPTWVPKEPCHPG